MVLYPLSLWNLPVLPGDYIYADCVPCRKRLVHRSMCWNRQRPSCRQAPSPHAQPETERDQQHSKYECVSAHPQRNDQRAGERRDRQQKAEQERGNAAQYEQPLAADVASQADRRAQFRGRR